MALKNSVYVLPLRPETTEDFRWLLREIVAEGGEATLCEADFVEGITPRDLVAMFAAERDGEYAELVVAAQRIVGTDRPLEDAERIELEAELGRLRRRMEEIEAIDYFSAPGRRTAERALAMVEARVRTGAARARPKGGEEMRGHTWVTRRDVFVDRIASAWLIRRFIDPKAKFKFTGSKTYRPKPGEVRFDMFEAEYTHEGDRCTFETLLERAALRDRRLTAIRGDRARHRLQGREVRPGGGAGHMPPLLGGPGGPLFDTPPLGEGGPLRPTTPPSSARALGYSL